MIGGGPGGSKFKVYVKVMKIFASSLKGPGKISTLYTIPPSPKTKHIVRFGHFWPRPSLLFAVVLIMTKIPKKTYTFDKSPQIKIFYSFKNVVVHTIRKHSLPLDYKCTLLTRTPSPHVNTSFMDWDSPLPILKCAYKFRCLPLKK